MKGLGCPAIVTEFSIAGSVGPEPDDIFKVTSAATKTLVGFPVGIISVQSSSLHSNGALNKLSSIKGVHPDSAENETVIERGSPLEGNVIPVNV